MEEAGCCKGERSAEDPDRGCSAHGRISAPGEVVNGNAQAQALSDTSARA